MVLPPTFYPEMSAMNLRDRFACAFAGHLAERLVNPEHVAKEAYSYADAMLKVRKGNTEGSMPNDQ